MAKKKKKNIQNKGADSVETNVFVKGMNKDINPSYEPKQSWTHARNAANNSTDGDVGVLGNEPANLPCSAVMIKKTLRIRYTNIVCYSLLIYSIGYISLVHTIP